MEEQGLDLRQYFYNLLKWWWLLLVGTLVGGLALFLLLSGGVPLYQSGATVLVQSGANPGNVTAAHILVTEDITAIYSEIAKTRSIMEKVVDDLDLSYSPDGLANVVDVRVSGSIIIIEATDPDPTVAAGIANGTAKAFIDDFQDRQLTQLAKFQNALSQYGIQIDAQLAANSSNTMSILSILEDASPANSPISTHTLRNTLAGGFLGLVLAVFLVLLIQGLDDRIKSPDELKAVTNLVVMGSIPRFKDVGGARAQSLANEAQEGSMAQAYGFLRTNLGFSALGSEELRSLLVTSAGPADGKTTTASNLAIALAREGKSVILMDMDLRKPNLHRFFGIPNDKGVTTLLAGITPLDEALQSTEIPTLSILTSGPIPADVTMILRSPVTGDMIKQVRDSVDIVIVDSPPLLAVTDPMVITPQVDGALLVVSMESAGKRRLRRAAELLHQAEPPFSGAVLNMVTRGRAVDHQYYYYYDYYPYSANPNGKSGRFSKLRAFSKIFSIKKKHRTPKTKMQVLNQTDTKV